MSSTPRRLLVSFTAVAAISTGAAVAFAAPASASACVGSTDHGHWVGPFFGGHVGGTWYNCGTSGDHVKIVVNNASDSPCTYVGPRSQRDVRYDPTFWGGGDHYRYWARC